MKQRTKIFIVVTSLLSVSIAALLNQPLQSVEQQFTAGKYRLRGDVVPDTNIVIVYIDNEAIKTVGWPVRRNFYAAMLKALSGLQARAVGVEVFFEEKNIEFREYDDLLVSVMTTAHNVVLPAYFQHINYGDDPAGSKDPETNRSEDVYWAGKGLHLPFDSVRIAAAGIGHLNFTEETTIPPFINSDKGTIPAFALDLLRVASGAAPDEVHSTDGLVSIPRNGGQVLHARLSTHGVMELNYPGRISAFTLYPFLEVLRSYDALVTGENPTIPVERLKDKIVLVGIVAEGRSIFLSTPIDPRYPSIGIHAVLLDDLLNNRLQTSAGDWLVYGLSLLVALVCAALVLITPPRYSRLLVPLIGIGSCVISYFFFALSAYLLPVTPFLLCSLAPSLAALIYKFRMDSEGLEGLERENESITGMLHDKEAKLLALEQELRMEKTNRPSDRTEELLAEIRRYKAEIRELSSKADDMVPHSDGRGENEIVRFEGIVGARDGQMKKVIEFIGKIADSDAPVLILGESGTGKELVARALHRRSRRSAGPFIAVNCGALSEGVLESELFGHERGAFTGAVKEKPGRFELANGGTIFLDEIGEVSEGFQVKLLRVLQGGEIERVGGTKTLVVNVRVLAATNRDMKHQLASKKFREDLYYRLNVLSIELPPLRERGADVDLLVDHFLARETEGLQISRNVMSALQSYSWPGNVRELESMVKRGALLAKADRRSMLTMKDLTDEIRTAIQRNISMEDQVIQAVREKGFSRSAISEAADELGGLHRGTVAEYLRGQCLRAFVEHNFDLGLTVQSISLSGEHDVNERVEKKVVEYLTNIAEVIDTSQSWESLKPLLKAKTKNLPQSYHPYVEQVAEAFYRGSWKI